MLARPLPIKIGGIYPLFVKIPVMVAVTLSRDSLFLSPEGKSFECF